MPIIYRYLTQETLKAIAMLLVMIIGIYLVVDFFEKIDDFMEAKLPMVKALTYFVFKIPFIISQVAPVCLLLGVLIVFGLMNKNNEIIALKSSGVSIYYLVLPILSIGVLASILLFLLSEVIVPLTQAHANRIWLVEVRHEAAVIVKEKNIWIKGNRSIAHVKHFDANRQMIFGLTLNQFDRKFRLVRRLDADWGIYQNGMWHLKDVMEQERQANGQYTVKMMDLLADQLDFTPENLMRVVKKSEEMSFEELLQFIKKVEEEGYDATVNRVDLYNKLAMPFVCIIMCVVGTGVALKSRIKEGLPVSIVYGVSVAFVYWIFHSFCLSLGYGQMLPPPLAAWIANLVFVCFGLYTLLAAE